MKALMGKNAKAVLQDKDGIKQVKKAIQSSHIDHIIVLSDGRRFKMTRAHT